MFEHKTAVTCYVNVVESQRVFYEEEPSTHYYNQKSYAAPIQFVEN